jgi:transposase
MRIIGIDLGVTAKHRAIIADERGRFVSGVIKFETSLSELERVMRLARAGMDPGAPLVVVMEATNIAWYAVAVYYHRLGAVVYVINPRMSADLARFYHRHARSDRLAAKVLARMPIINPDRLYPWTPASADHLALQRGCKELDRLVEQITAIKNRLQSTDVLAWPGLNKRVFSDPLSPAARWFRQHGYAPQRGIELGVGGLQQAWRAASAYTEDETWIEPLVKLANELLHIYGAEGDYLDYPALSAEVSREQHRLAELEADEHFVRLKVTRPRYRQLHPSRNLETIKGVGQDGAAVHVGFTADPSRFLHNRSYRGWSGMVPCSAQSGQAESKGLHISQAGPDLVKKFAYIDADTARQYDPQLAALYYDQMVNKGKHHSQAVCACATHLMDRILIILKDDRPYELRDVDGTPVTPEQARTIIAERYTVPQAVREHNNKYARKERAQRRAEQTDNKRRSRS